MEPSTARALLPTAATVLVVALGALVTQALHAHVPVVLVAVSALVLVGAAAAAWRCATRRRDPLDLEWAAVEPAWRDRSQ